MKKVSSPNHSCPSVLMRTSYEDGLAPLSCKPELPPAAPGQDVIELKIGGINHVRSLLPGVAVREGAVISISRCHKEAKQESIVPQEGT